MKFSKRIALAAATLGLTAVTVAPVFAATSNTTGSQTNPRTSLIQALAQRFNLSQADVQSFFDQQRQTQMRQHAAQAQMRLEERLTSLVSSGKLTEAQKTALIAKAKEAQAKHEEARKLTPEECKKVMDAYRTELENWLTQQGLDKSYVRDLIGPGPGGHGGRGGMMGGPEGRNGFGGGRGPRGGFGGPMGQNGQASQSQNGGVQN